MAEENPESKKRRTSEEECSSVAVDRLSNLPDDILGRILALVPTKLAVQTSVLSRRWSSLWRAVPALDLDRAAFSDALPFIRFADRVISGRNDTTATIHRFHLAWSRDVDERRALRWLDHAVHHGAEVIELDVTLWNDDNLAGRLLGGDYCPNVEILSLYPCGPLQIPGEPVGLRNLRRLHLVHATGDGVALGRLVSNCPLLEDVEISGSFTDAIDIVSDSLRRLSLQELSMPGMPTDMVSVSAPNLRSLFLHCSYGNGPSLIRVFAPSLASFDYYGSSLQDDLLGEFAYLFKAGVSISDFSGFGDFHVVRILQSLKNASVLTLADMTVDYLSKEQSLPTFHNLKHMKLLLNKQLDKAIIEVIVELISYSPKLEKLVVDERRRRSSKSLGCYQKTQRVSDHRGCKKEFQLLKMLCKDKNITLSIDGG